MYSTIMLTAVFYIIGIYSADFIGLSATFFLSLALLICGVFKSRIKGLLLLAAMSVCLGVLRFGIADDTPLLRYFSDRYVQAEGVIYSQATESGGEYKNKYTLKLDTISCVGDTYKADGKVIIHTRENFDFGDRVLVSGFVSEISSINNEYEYDFYAYYKSRGIYGRIVAREAQKIGEAFSFSPEFLAGEIKAKLSNVISLHYEGNRGAILKAILLGDKSGFDRDYKEMLIRTGIYRSLYSPHIHISFIFLMAGIFCRERKSRERLAVILILVYALFNSISPTVIKACSVSVLLIFRKEIFGFADKLQVLSMVVFVLTLADPMLCFNSGFVVSVLSTVLVYLSYPTVYKKVSAILAKRKIRATMLCRVITIWLIFTVGTMPVCALFYNGVSVYSSLYSVLMLPVTIVLGLISVPAIMFGANNINSVFDWILHLAEILPEFADKLPLSFLRLSTPTIREILIFYIGWWIFMRLLAGKFNTDKTKILITVAAALVVLGFSSHSINTLSVNFVNVGQGDGAVLHTTRGETVIIDGGGAADYEENYNVGEQVFVPYLVSHGFGDIDVAILSHYHKDHAEGIIAAAEKLKINTLVMPDADPENKYRKRLEELSEEKKFRIEYLSAGDEIRFKSGLSIKFLAPDSEQEKSDELNDTSLVAHITYGEFDALFTGDSTDKINSSYPQGVELLKVAHHGSATSDSEEYVSHIRPEYAVISVGEDNSYGLPDYEVVDRLKRYGAKVLRTDKSGDIRFKVKKDGKITYKTLKGE